MRRSHKMPVVAEINVVPYIDVMLVLLIIFMVTAPLVLQGPPVDLPQSGAKPVQTEVIAPLVITLETTGKVTVALGSKVLPYRGEDAFVKTIQQAAGHSSQAIFLRADKRCAYDQVATLLARLQMLGIGRVNLVTS